MHRPSSLHARWLAGLVLGCAAGTAAAAEDAQALLARMVEAARTLNYDGTFAYRKGEVMESMRIIHRVESDGRERERLVSLNGTPREVIRDDSEVRCILPDDGAVVVAKSRTSSALPQPAQALARAGGSRYYRLSVASAARVAGRETRSVTIEPVDRYRYGYTLWLDAETSLLLRSQVQGPDGAVLEEIVYTSITLPESIPDALLEPESTSRAFTVKDLRAAQAPEVPTPAWTVDDLPPGFMITDRDAAPGLSGVPGPMAHLVVSDGIASASVFVEPLAGGVEPLEGASSMGPVSAFGRVRDGHQITVVGELPPTTVEWIAGAVAPL